MVNNIKYINSLVCDKVIKKNVSQHTQTYKRLFVIEPPILNNSFKEFYIQIQSRSDLVCGVQSI